VWLVEGHAHHPEVLVSHANARLNVFARRLIVTRWQAGWAQAHIAAAMGVSRQCVSKWIHRWLAEGEAGLVDRSSRPHTCPTQTPPQVEERVLEARQRLRCGPEGLAEATGVPARTASRVLARRGVPHLADCDPITGQPIRASRATPVRYERAAPGDLVHMDVKKLGRIRDGGGWRVHGRATTEAAKHQNPAGYDYIHSLIDDHSRLAYSEVLGDEKGVTCAGFLLRAAAYFADHGITRIERLMTDNALAYRKSLTGVCAQLGTRQKFIRPHCPWQNGKVERLNRTLATEWAYRRPYTSNDQRTAALADWLEHYNTQRRHSALGGKPPISRLTPT
jgi:transposase InsO family protein